MKLNDYLESDAGFRSWILLFMGVFDLDSNCRDKHGNHYEFMAAPAIEMYAREEADGGVILRENQLQYQHYYSENLCEEQAFAVAFCIWYGLPESILQLVDIYRYRNLSWYILHAFLCGMPEEDIRKLASNTAIPMKQRKAAFSSLYYKGEHTIYRDEDTILAYRKGDCLFAKDTDEVFLITED